MISNNDPSPKSPTEIGDNEDFPVLETRMVSPMSGLEAHLNFSLSTVDETRVLWILQSTMDSSVRLFATPPIVFSDGYSPIIPPSARLRIGLAEGADPLILVIVYPTTGPHPHTVNLLAPLIINPDTMGALQAVFGDQDWPLQAPIGNPR